MRSWDWDKNGTLKAHPRSRFIRLRRELTVGPNEGGGNMVSKELLRRVADEARQHCAAKGYLSGPNWNPLVPYKSVAAFAMAKRLTESGDFDAYVAVAPEGHVYGYFFERFGVRVLSVTVDYPPRVIELGKDLESIRGARVLLLEDDIVSGLTLSMVVQALRQFEPLALSVYLGRDKEGQQLQNVPGTIRRVYLAEDFLEPETYNRYEAEFLKEFRGLLSS